MDKKKALRAICNEVCGDLPEGYTFKLCLEYGAGWIEVEAPNLENIIPQDFGVDVDMDDQITQAIAFAKGHAKAHNWTL